MNERISKLESGSGLAEKCKREERSNRRDTVVGQN